MVQERQYELAQIDTHMSGSRVASISSAEIGDAPHDDDYDQQLDKRVVRKLDYILLPFLSLLFLLNGLDRSNIGNAETAGFSHDTGLGEGDINVAMAFFFAFFVALQPIGAALGRKFGMALWVPACMSIWGLCTILHIWVKSRNQLIALRVVIACLEAGFYPTTVSYLSLFYTRYEFAIRLGYFYGQNAVAGALGGVISWAIFSHFSSDIGILRSWQFLFLIEGSTTLVIALVGFVWLPHNAGSAWFLTSEERLWAEHRIRIDHDQSMHVEENRSRSLLRRKISSESIGAQERLLQPSSQDDADQESLEQTDDIGDRVSDSDARLDGSSHGLQLHNQNDDNNDDSSLHRMKMSTMSLTADSGLDRIDVISAFFQYKIWHLLVCNVFSSIPATAFGIFLPMVVKRISPDISPAAANLFTAPPFIFGAITLLTFTRWSDTTRRRLLPILCGLLILLVGTAITVLTPMSNYIIRYIGLCILLGGSFIASPLTVAWIANNTPQPGKRAILLGINGWGNLAGMSSAFLFTPDDAKNDFTRSFLLTLLCVLLSSIGYLSFFWFLRLENSWRQSTTNQWSDDERKREALFGNVELEYGRLTLLRNRMSITFGWDGIRRGDERLTFQYSL